MGLPSLPATKKVRKVVSKINWTECFDLVPVDDTEALAALVKTTFLESGILSSNHIVDNSKLEKIVARIQSGYCMTPYHNFNHAVHVFMGVNSLLQHSRIKWTRIEKCALLFTAIIHDLEHQGVPNVQLVKESSPLALKYNNQSVAENNSFDQSLNLLIDENETMNIFDDFTLNEKLKFQYLCKEIILATDIGIANQNNIKAIYSKIENAVKDYSDNDVKGSGNSNDNNSDWIVDGCEDMIKMDVSNEENRQIALCLIMKCADVGAPLQHLNTSYTWAERFYNENRNAYRLGRGNPIDHDNFIIGQDGFYQHYLLHVIEVMASMGVIDNNITDNMTMNLQNLRKHWKTNGVTILNGWKRKWEELWGDGVADGDADGVVDGDENMVAADTEK
jgi:hypothetical protein